jgi:DNA-binding transcriptional LysR family regulator
VSLRIQSLENNLGCSLFDRGRGGARLTPHGKQFHHYALIIKRMWDQARLDVSLPRGVLGQVRLGGPYSLWRHFLTRWFAWMRKEAAAIALRTEAHANATIMQHLSDGMLDLGVMFDPEQRTGFAVERLFEEALVLVSTRPDSTAPQEPGYMLVDWGPEFQRFHSAQFAELPLPALQTNLGALAVDQILSHGGSGYFPEPVVQPFLERGMLFRVPGAPQFPTPIFAVYRDGPLPEPLRIALEGLRQVASSGGLPLV